MTKGDFLVEKEKGSTNRGKQRRGTLSFQVNSRFIVRVA